MTITTPDSGLLSHVKLHFVNDLDTLWACQRWLGSNREGPLGYDTESGGLDPHRHRNRLIQLGDLNDGWAFPAHGWGGAAVELLSRYPGELVAHNGTYDNRVLNVHWGWQVPWHKTHDALIAKHLIDSHRPAALKAAATREVDPRAAAADRVLKEAMAANHWTWDTVPVEYPGYHVYGALDPVLTCWLWKLNGPQVLADYRASYDLERAVARVAAGMMTAGMLIDKPYITHHIDQMSAWLSQAMIWLRAHHGIGTVNSNTQLGRAFERAGIKITLWTPGGKPQMNKDALKFYRSQYPQHAGLIDTVIKARKAADIIHDHLEKCLEMAAADGRVHASIHTCQARTSRMSVTDPALQTLDRDEPVVRGCYIPSPGNVFVSWDANQIEARLAAHFSGDRNMIQMFRDADESGISFFRQFLGQVYGIPYEQTSKKDPRYTWAKNSFYSFSYGAGLEKMAATAGVTVDQMSPIYNGLRHLYPGLTALMNRLIREARSRDGRPYVVTPMGRRLYCDPGKEYALLNTLIQGHAGEILKQGGVKMDAAGFGPYLRLFVHDEIIAEVPKQYAAEALRTGTQLLTDTGTYSVPITWEGSVMEKRWVKQ